MRYNSPPKIDQLIKKWNIGPDHCSVPLSVSGEIQIAFGLFHLYLHHQCYCCHCCYDDY
uniref:Uncharacterized protein n=1 Tax=Anguilla anguilla TaxID=7936 RepID=A0A0E9WFE1_ANGAN